MAAKPLTTEAVALTEKKMDMTLDDIIKMSKKTTSKGKRPPRMPIKGRGFFNGNVPQGNSKVQQFMNSRSSIRQGVLAQRRSNFQGNQFPVTTQVGKKAAAMPIHNRMVNWKKPRFAPMLIQRKAADVGFAGKDKVALKQRPQTLDALFANMKEQRMRASSQQSINSNGNGLTAQRRLNQQRRGRDVGPSGGNNRRFGNFS
ncbi:uncharacterized protein [Typha angustifolia]|uniref:uncharacterized protein n=1 Tax=Typha angustifolia TaxID=59011 RepID=UPI003C2CD38F